MKLTPAIKQFLADEIIILVMMGGAMLLGWMCWTEYVKRWMRK